MELMKITDVTAKYDVSSRTLRYYEQMGLLESVRPQFEKYRFYDAENLERLKQILVLRKMQIPIRDIVRIYERRDMSDVVEVFVRRIDAIDEEIHNLSELKRIVNEFLQTMVQNGIKQIDALPLLYEEMGRQLELREEKKTATYQELSEVAEKLTARIDADIAELPAMRMLTSVLKQTGMSDPEEFWDWFGQSGLSLGLPGQHTLFELQNDRSETVFIQRVESEFENNSPFMEERFEGGLFASASAYADDDIGAFHRSLIRSFDANPYYEVDYRHDGKLRHESLAETVISPDGKREKLRIFIPVKKRLPDASLYDPNDLITNITVEEIEAANPILWQKDVPMDGFIPILNPGYKVNEQGEAEYIPYIDKRLLSTGLEVKIPYRVDIEFKVDDTTQRYGYGSTEGSLRFYHGENLAFMYGVNMDNNADDRLSQEAIRFNQPILGESFYQPKAGKINRVQYNRLTWIIGEKHFAVIINGEVRYCGVNFPYMKIGEDLRLQPARTILLGSNGQGKIYIRKVQVAQLKLTPKMKIKEGDLTMTNRQSNNMIMNIHKLITMHYGENYWFNGCAKYVMECLGEPDYDYWFFGGLTGDNFAQVFAYERFLGDGLTDYRMCDPGKPHFIETVFEKCGYASTFIPNRDLSANREMYLQTLMAYIDKGIPVIRYQWGWSVFVGYEDYGKTLLFMTSDKTEPQRVSFEQVFSLPDGFTDEDAAFYGYGWVFVGEKKAQKELKQIYRDAIFNLPNILTTKTDRYCFGAEAFRAWADELESGKYDGMKPEQFDGWTMYTIYVCNLSTNGSCCHEFLKRAHALNPDMDYLEEVSRLYKQTEGPPLETLGGGFNVTLAALQDHEKRSKITAKIREFADRIDEVVRILSEKFKSF